MPKLLLGAILVLSFLIAYACSSGGSGDKDEPQTEAGLEAAVRTAIEALFDGRYDVLYARLAQECRDKQSEADYVKEIAAGIVLAQTFLDVEFADLRIKSIDARNVEDGRGEVQVSIETPDNKDVAFDEDEGFDPWVYEDGQWRSLECGSGDSAFGDDSTSEESAEAEWTSIVEMNISAQSGGVTLTLTEVRTGTPEAALPDRIASEWEGVDSVVRFAATITNDTDRKVSVFAYSAKAVIEGKQVEVESFESELPDELLPRASADMLFVFPVTGIDAEDIHDLRLALDAPTDDETFEPVGPDLLIETSID